MYIFSSLVILKHSTATYELRGPGSHELYALPYSSSLAQSPQNTLLAGHRPLQELSQGVLKFSQLNTDLNQLESCPCSADELRVNQPTEVNAETFSPIPPARHHSLSKKPNQQITNGRNSYENSHNSKRADSFS